MVPLTVEDCKEYVQLKLKKLSLVLGERGKVAQDLMKNLKAEMEVLKLLEHRAEYLRREYELDLLALMHREGKRSIRGGRQVDHGAVELASLEKKVAAEDACYSVWTNTRALGKKLSDLTESMDSMLRIADMWEEKTDSYAARLYEELTRPDIRVEEAFQNAGLDCRCEDVNCDFPHEVDDNHNYI